MTTTIVAQGVDDLFDVRGASGILEIQAGAGTDTINVFGLERNTYAKMY